MSPRILNETLVPLRQSADWYPITNRGRKPHLSTIWRHAVAGVIASDGTRVKLETVKTPSGLCTSREAVLRFFARLSDMKDASQPTDIRLRQIEVAENLCDAAGI